MVTADGEDVVMVGALVGIEPLVTGAGSSVDSSVDEGLSVESGASVDGVQTALLSAIVKF